MPAAVAVPAAIAGGGALLSAFGGERASKRASADARYAANQQASYEGGPYTAPLRGAISSSLMDYLGQGDVFGGDTDNLIRSRYRELLSDPTRLDSLLSGDAAYKMLDEYGARTRPAFQQDLGEALNAARVGTGSAYGLRGGTDLTRILGDVGRRASVSRDAQLTSLFPQFLQYGLQGEQLRFDELGRARADWQARQDPLLRYAMALPGFPSQAPTQPYQPWQSTLGNYAQLAPLYAEYFKNQQGGGPGSLSSYYGGDLYGPPQV